MKIEKKWQEQCFKCDYVSSAICTIIVPIIKNNTVPIKVRIAKKTKCVRFKFMYTVKVSEQ